jgi:hypothetical protein
LSRRTGIEAAITAHNDTDPEALLPPAAARLLIAMFRPRDVCQRSMESLVAEGFDSARFLSKESGHKPSLCQLHPRNRQFGF